MVAERTRSGNMASHIVVRFALCGIQQHGGVKRKAPVLESLHAGERISMQAALTLPQGMAKLLPTEPKMLKQAMALLE